MSKYFNTSLDGVKGPDHPFVDDILEDLQRDIEIGHIEISAGEDNKPRTPYCAPMPALLALLE